MRKISFFAAAIVAALAASPGLADLSSRYSVAGRDAIGHTGQNYAITAAFDAAGQIYHANFIAGANSIASGVAVEYDNFLGLAARGSDGRGYLALYQRIDTGWSGIITAYSSNDLGAQALYNGRVPALLDPKQTPSSEVTGKFPVSGTNPDGSSYSGEVEIAPDSDLFDIFRDIVGKSDAVGTVIAVNGALVMNVARERREIGTEGVFIPQPDGFLGVWNQPGSDRLGAERWVRK